MPRMSLGDSVRYRGWRIVQEVVGVRVYDNYSNDTGKNKTVTEAKSFIDRYLKSKER